jgi:hypothetical protein
MLKFTLSAVLGPAFLNVTVPVTVWPALALVGKLKTAATSAIADPLIVAVALVPEVLGLSVVVVMLAVTVEVPELGCAYVIVIGPTVPPAGKVAGMPTNTIAPVLVL